MRLVLVLSLILWQAPAGEQLRGARNVIRVDATVMCGGATSPEAFPHLRDQDFRSVLTLRRAGEPGFDLEAARAAAERAGLTYIHVPVDPANPSPDEADAFLRAVTETAHQPIYIHCGTGNRVGAMWLIKRVVVDGWDLERATREARAIGLTSPALERFAGEYAARHTR